MILKFHMRNLLKMSFLFAALLLIGCGGSGTTTVSTPADVTGAWSDPATWGGEVPKASADVVITSNMDVTLDVSPPQLASLTIEGQLEFANADLELEVGYIHLTGELWIGTSAAPFEHNATITLTDLILQKAYMDWEHGAFLLTVAGLNSMDLHLKQSGLS